MHLDCSQKENTLIMIQMVQIKNDMKLFILTFILFFNNAISQTKKKNECFLLNPKSRFKKFRL